MPILSPSPPEHPSALLCDADGNLFPSEEPAFVASAEVTNRLLAEHGVARRLDPDDLRLATTGMSFRATVAALAEEYGIGLSDDEQEYWVDQERIVVTRHLSRILQPDPRVLQPLSRLAPAMVLAAVSSSATERLDASLAATGLSGLIGPGRRFSAEDSLPRPASKPDPAVYTYACRQLRIRPDRAVAVEDSVPGVTSAVAAGVATLGNLQFVPEAERTDRAELLTKAGAYAVAASWSEVEALVTPPRCPGTPT